MRDEIDGRIWTAHHQQFSETIDGAVRALGARMRDGARLAGRIPSQLLGLGAAIAMSTLIVSVSIA